MAEERYIHVRLTFEEEEAPYLLDITSLLYDLELLYDLWVLAIADDYADYRFTRNFWYRAGRPLRKEHRLRPGVVSRRSPLLLEILVPLIPGIPLAVYQTLKIMDKVRDWGPSRERRQLELEKLRRETRILAIEEERAWQEFEQAVLERGAAGYQERLVRRLKRSPLALEDIQVLAPPHNQALLRDDGGAR